MRHGGVSVFIVDVRAWVDDQAFLALRLLVIWRLSLRLGLLAFLVPIHTLRKQRFRGRSILFTQRLALAHVDLMKCYSITD